MLLFLSCRKHALNCHRMKPALFNVLCEIKEKTGRTEIPTFKHFLWPIDSLNQQWQTHYLNTKISAWKYCQDWSQIPIGSPGSSASWKKHQVSLTVIIKHYWFIFLDSVTGLFEIGAQIEVLKGNVQNDVCLWGKNMKVKVCFLEENIFGSYLKPLCFWSWAWGLHCLKFPFLFFLVIVPSSRRKVFSSVVKYLCGKRHTTSGYRCLSALWFYSQGKRWVEENIMPRDPSFCCFSTF